VFSLSDRAFERLAKLNRTQGTATAVSLKIIPQFHCAATLMLAALAYGQISKAYYSGIHEQLPPGH
jgi:hypothetical protein